MITYSHVHLVWIFMRPRLCRHFKCLGFLTQVDGLEKWQWLVTYNAKAMINSLAYVPVLGGWKGLKLFLVFLVASWWLCNSWLGSYPQKSGELQRAQIYMKALIFHLFWSYLGLLYSQSFRLLTSSFHLNLIQMKKPKIVWILVICSVCKPLESSTWAQR